MTGRYAPVPDHLSEEEANLLMKKRARVRRRQRVVKENLKNGIDPATTRLRTGVPIQPTDGLTEQQIRHRVVSRHSMVNVRRKKNGLVRTNTIPVVVVCKMMLVVFSHTRL